MNQYGFVSKFWDPSQIRRGGGVVQSEQEKVLPHLRGTIGTSQQMQSFFWRRHTLTYSGLFAPQPLKLFQIIASGCLAKSCLNADQLHLKIRAHKPDFPKKPSGHWKIGEIFGEKKKNK